jgi:hypothetical protein
LSKRPTPDGLVRFTLPIAVVDAISLDAIARSRPSGNGSGAGFSYRAHTSAGIEVTCTRDFARALVDVLRQAMLDEANPSDLTLQCGTVLARVVESLNPAPGPADPRQPE